MAQNLRGRRWTEAGLLTITRKRQQNLSFSSAKCIRSFGEGLTSEATV